MSTNPKDLVYLAALAILERFQIARYVYNMEVIDCKKEKFSIEFYIQYAKVPKDNPYEYFEENYQQLIPYFSEDYDRFTAYVKAREDAEKEFQAASADLEKAKERFRLMGREFPRL